jgi:hypothetical protein
MCDEISIDRNGCLGPFDPTMSSMLFYTPVKNMIGILEKYKDNNWICDMGYTLSCGTVTAFEEKVKQMLTKKYTWSV